MRLYPVIMCGGAGTRLWPASRPSRPKQFIPLAGNRSLFQEAGLRVAPLVQGGGRVLVVGGVAHRRAILDQLHEVGVEAQVFLEPEARDSAPAMAVAAAWTQAHDPDGVNVFVASDHHIPDAEGFRVAVRQAAVAARDGRIVTLGVQPYEPSEAYGYIRPQEADLGMGRLGHVRAFVEKPDRRTAIRYIEQGCLWNSGNFIASAGALLNELADHAPGVGLSAQAALKEVDASPVITLGPSFRGAPKVSIDYAVMEKTDNAWVLPVDFGWSDLGAWDAVAATGEGEIGSHIFEDAEGCLVRAPDGMLIAALGVRDLAIVAERDAVLVCDLSRAQDVRKLVERVRVSSPQHADFPSDRHEGGDGNAEFFADWLRLRALPLWSAMGQDDQGAFVESMGLDGRVVVPAPLAVTQARQIQAFAQAGLLGWPGPWRRHVEAGLSWLDATLLDADGGFRKGGDMNRPQSREAADLAAHAAVLKAWAMAAQAGVGRADLEDRALRLHDRLHSADEGWTGRWDEAACLAEAAQAWGRAGGSPVWASRAAWAARRALERLVRISDGAAVLSEEGRRLEPCRCFQWAWLFARHEAGDDARFGRAALRLYEQGRAGVDVRSELVLDGHGEEDDARGRRAHLVSQAWWLRAALELHGSGSPGRGDMFLHDARRALCAVVKYLTPDGLWRDERLEDGRFIEAAVSARSLYHLAACYGQMIRSDAMELDGKSRLGPY